MAESNPALYRWKRWTSPKPAANTVTKSKKLTGTEDIQDWIKKVQEASDRAAAVTFGHKYTGGSHGNSMATAMATVDALHDHDSAYQEAQELLNQWMSDKCHLDDDDENMDEMLSCRSPPTRSEVKKQWDDLLAVEDPGFPHPYNGISSNAFVQEIEERDEESTVESIIQGMLDKPVVEGDFFQDLGLDDRKKKGKDPSISMQARHQRVKENREKRMKERDRQLRDKQRQKDAQHQAQQMILKEEKEKAMRKRNEESMIQQEMARIRKEMEEQRKTTEEVQRRERERWDAEKNREKEEQELKERQRELRKQQAQQMLEDEKKEMTQRLQEMKANKATEDLRCLQRHFSAWYQLVVNRRIQLGKARALSDWRRLVGAWNAWRHYVHQQHIRHEERETQLYIRDAHRKRHLAEEFHRRTLLRKYFVTWQLWVAQEVQSRELTQRKRETKNKMAAFLEAAASGKLWTNRKEDDSLYVDDLESPHSNRSSDRPDSTRRKVDDLFDQPARRLQNHSVPSTDRSDWSLPDAQSKKPKPLEKPKFAWQVTRQHLNLTTEQMANRKDGEQNNAVEPTQENLQNNDGSRNRRIPYTVNNFEHRYAAQQKILQEQQKQLKEQQRLIIEMQATQRQQILQHELNNLQDTNSPSQKPSNVKDVNKAANNINQPLSARSQSSDTLVSARSDSTSSTGSNNLELNNAKKNSKASSNFLKGMEERAARIAQRKAEADERKRKREEEKLAEIRVKEEQRRQEEEAEKKAKIERSREERRLAKQREQEKQERLDRINRHNAKADDHYRRTLLRNKGLKPWLKLVAMSRQNMQVAVDHHNTVLMDRCFTPWKEMTQEAMQEKQRMADELYKYILARRAFASWKRYGHLQSIQLQKARRHYSYTTKVKYFKLWQDYTVEEKLAMMAKEELAEEHNQYRIVKTSFNTWRRYPQLVKDEEKRKKRIEEMRKKVQSMLPDFGVS